MPVSVLVSVPEARREEVVVSLFGFPVPGWNLGKRGRDSDHENDQEIDQEIDQDSDQEIHQEIDQDSDRTVTRTVTRTVYRCCPRAVFPFLREQRWLCLSHRALAPCGDPQGVPI